MQQKIDDIAELREELIAAYETKSHQEVARFSVMLAKHILEITHTAPREEILNSFAVNERWQNGQAKFQEARATAFALHRLAREEQDPLKIKVLRVMGQVAATPHVKRHAIAATDYAVKVINLMYPGNLEEVKKERKSQIDMMKSI